MHFLSKANITIRDSTWILGHLDFRVLSLMTPILEAEQLVRIKGLGGITNCD